MINQLRVTIKGGRVSSATLRRIDLCTTDHVRVVPDRRVLSAFGVCAVCVAFGGFRAYFFRHFGLSNFWREAISFEYLHVGISTISTEQEKRSKTQAQTASFLISLSSTLLFPTNNNNHAEGIWIQQPGQPLQHPWRDEFVLW